MVLGAATNHENFGGGSSSIVCGGRMGVRGRDTLAPAKPAYEYGRGAAEAQPIVASGSWRRARVGESPFLQAPGARAAAGGCHGSFVSVLLWD